MLFRQGTDTGKRTAARSGGTTDAQLKELRGKARRRLIGALTLVLAAFIVVPWLFDEPVQDDTHAPVVVPAVPPGLPPVASISGTAGVATPASPAEDAVTQDDVSSMHPDGAATSTPDQDAKHDQAAATPDATGSVAASISTPPPAPPAAEKPADVPAKPAKPSAKPAERTDDGSVALALLSGKSPTAANSGAVSAKGQGRYYLQVAAYTTEQDAQSRRDSLRQSGVTDAYVESGQSGGRTVYRLRVGPFGSHEAAQAAQARLRALGYQNGLISDK